MHSLKGSTQVLKANEIEQLQEKRQVLLTQVCCYNIADNAQILIEYFPVLSCCCRSYYF